MTWVTIRNSYFIGLSRASKRQDMFTVRITSTCPERNLSWDSNEVETLANAGPC